MFPSASPTPESGQRPRLKMLLSETPTPESGQRPRLKMLPNHPVKVSRTCQRVGTPGTPFDQSGYTLRVRSVTGKGSFLIGVPSVPTTLGQNYITFPTDFGWVHRVHLKILIEKGMDTGG